MDKVVLTIAGSDSGGGAGIQADLKTFEAHRVYGTSVITALTAQNTVGVQQVRAVPEPMVKAQLKSVMDDFDVAAAKTGMLQDKEIISIVVNALSQALFPIVVDPVMVSSSGDPLLASDALAALRSELLPLATVITPNLQEAARLTGFDVKGRADMTRAATALAELYPKAWILVKGGHLSDGSASDLLVHGDFAEWLEGPHIDSPNTHGTGCTLSAAITARLALGDDVPQAVRAAKAYLTGALQYAWSGLGKGRGSLRHYYNAS